MPNITMRARDALSAKMAECYVTIGQRRYNAFNALNLEAEFKKNKMVVPILGKTGQGNKANGWSGTGKMTLHYNTSIYRQMMLDYKDSGEDMYFDIQITNEDPTSAAGRQTITLLDCNIDGGVLAKFDADGDILDEEVEFTYEDFKMPESFNLLEGM